jgi:hypothetical protein
MIMSFTDGSPTWLRSLLRDLAQGQTDQGANGFGVQQPVPLLAAAEVLKAGVDELESESLERAGPDRRDAPL